MATRNRHSTAVVKRGHTVLDAAIAVLKREKKSLGPTAVAEVGVARGILRVPRGRTISYLAQLIQTKLQADASNGEGRVYRPRTGKYRARVSA